MLGRGTYGHVWPVGTDRCQKELASEFSSDPHERDRHFKEYETLCGLEHSNIVPVFGYNCYHSRPPSFEMPRLGPDAGKLLGRKGRGRHSLLSIDQLKNLQDALLYLFEEAKLVHFDVKLENLLVDGSEYVFIDFGLSEKNGTVVDAESVVTPGYRAPEHQGVQLRACTSLDVFALGVVALEMVVRRRLYAEFKKCAGSVILMQLLRDRLLREVADADMRGAIAAMLEIDVRQRHMNLVTRRPHAAAICSAGAQ